MRNSKQQGMSWLWVVLILMMGGPLIAQRLSSRVDGTVKDSSGAVIPTAAVTLVNEETNTTATTTTNESGLYVFPQVTAGKYRVVVEKSGFRKTTMEGFKIDVGVPATVNVNLEVGELSQAVEVVANEAQVTLNTVNAEINTVVEREQIQSLPLPGRSPTELALLQAGVTGRGSIARESSVNGTRGTFNNFTLDGVNNQDNYIRTDAFFGVIPLRESFIQEFNITTSNTSSDSGVGVSQTKMITRSGTNRYHGQLFYHHQNTALNANSFFNNSSGIVREKDLNHQYGGNLGGPVFKDKLFFFVDYEREKSPGAQSVVRTVLTPGARQGDFVYQREDDGQFQTVNLYQLGGAVSDPAIKKLIDMTPGFNDNSAGDGRNTAGYRFNSPDAQDSSWTVVRLDYVPSSRHNFEFVFHQFLYNNPNDVNNDNDSRFPGLQGAGQNSTRRLGTAAWRSTLSATLSNELRWGFQYAPAKFFTNQTFPEGYQLIFPALVENPVQNFMPQGRNAPVYELNDNATWVKGNHAFRLGGSLRYTSVNDYLGDGTVPQYTLGFSDTGNTNPLDPSQFLGGIGSNDFTTAGDMLALLGGFVTSSAQTFNVESQTSGFVKGAYERRLLKQRFYSLYGADTWRVTPRLSLSYGLRWEMHTVPFEANGLGLLPVGGVSDILKPDEMIDFVGGKSNRKFYNSDLNNFAPNIGIAWQPFANGRTVVRAGYAINYVNDNNFTGVTNALRGNDGLAQQVQNFGLSGTVSSDGINPLPQPEFKVPRSVRDNLDMDPAAAVYTIDPNLRVPYVQQWNVGVQHQLWGDTTFEIRYLGNRGVKLSRAVDINQVKFPTEFVEDFKRAQRNLAATGNPSRGETLQVLPNLGLGGYLQSSTVRTYIRNGEIGEYVGGFLAPNRAFFFAGEGGEEYGSTIPISLFYPNPNIYVADYLGNNSYSSYHALQMEVRRRFKQGLTFQANYTYGKVLTDFPGTQTNFGARMDNAQPSLEKMRADFDITHTFNANFVYELPFGAGKRFAAGAGWVNQMIGGWNASGILRLRSGPVVNIVSQRGTINRRGRSYKNTVNLVGMTIQDLQSKTGVFTDSRGRVLMFSPDLIAADGRPKAEIFQNPGLLNAGTLGLSPVSGPGYSNADFGLFKNTRLRGEKLSLQIRVEVFNVFNHTNFYVSRQGATNTDANGFFNGQSINSTSFGLINDTYNPRQMQIGLKLIF